MRSGKFKMGNPVVRSLVLLVLAVAVAGFCFLLPNAKVSNETGVFLQLPNSIVGMESEAIAMSVKEKKWLPDSTQYMKRSYYPLGEGPNSYNAVNVSLIVSGGDERSLHRPQVCMNGQGWAIPAQVIKTIEIGGQQVEIMDLYLKREQNGKVIEGHYYFFWVGKGISTPSYARMKLLSLKDNFFKNLNHRWAYPGIFTYVNPNAKDPQADAWKRAQYVMQQVIPHFHKGFGAEEIKSKN